jgi:hypothetical protein
MQCSPQLLNKERQIYFFFMQGKTFFLGGGSIIEFLWTLDTFLRHLGALRVWQWTFLQERGAAHPFLSSLENTGMKQNLQRNDDLLSEGEVTSDCAIDTNNSIWMRMAFIGFCAPIFQLGIDE